MTQNNIPQNNQPTLRGECGHIIELCQSHDEDGRLFWAYVALPPSSYIAWQKAREAGNSLEIMALGTVLLRGSGIAPWKS